jgi:hypothetical protein
VIVFVGRTDRNFRAFADAVIWKDSPPDVTGLLYSSLQRMLKDVGKPAAEWESPAPNAAAREPQHAPAETCAAHQRVSAICMLNAQRDVRERLRGLPRSQRGLRHCREGSSLCTNTATRTPSKRAGSRPHLATIASGPTMPLQRTSTRSARPGDRCRLGSRGGA